MLTFGSIILFIILVFFLIFILTTVKAGKKNKFFPISNDKIISSNKPGKKENIEVIEEKWTKEKVISKIEIINQRDDFEKTNIIHFKNVVLEGSGYLPMYYDINSSNYVSSFHLGLSFYIYKTNIFLEVISHIPDMNCAKGDRLILLFENGETIDFNFQYTKYSGGYSNSNSYVLSTKELKKIASLNLDKWKLISTRKKVFVAGDNTFFPESCKINERTTSQEILKYMATCIAAEYVKLKL